MGAFGNQSRPGFVISFSHSMELFNGFAGYVLLTKGGNNIGEIQTFRPTYELSPSQLRPHTPITTHILYPCQNSLDN